MQSITRRLFAAAAILIAAVAANAQQTAQPRQEKLLNGLKLLMFTGPDNGKVEAKLRIHSGAAFDPQGKEGTMRMLAEAMFPNQDSRDYFTQDLGGSFAIEANYDYIQITASSRSDQYLTLLETIANAVSTPNFDKEIADAVRAMVVKEAGSAEKSAASFADRQAAARLLGTFPYGRPVIGTTETLTKIDAADLRFAYDRFFGADNATLTVTGRIDPTATLRAARRFFGPWLKSDRRVPPTFKQPDAPPPGVYTIGTPEQGRSEMRFAFRGYARSDADLAASRVLTRIYQERLRAKVPADKRESVTVRNSANILPGTIVIAFTDIRRDPTSATKIELSDLLTAVLNEKVSDAEFAAAKSAVMAEYSAIDAATLWLDADTYRLASVKADQTSFAGVAISDVQRVADKMKTAPSAAVLVVDPMPAEQK